jgi:ribosome-associated toxin RatA of RatAB toxin-antitoxin module
MREVKRSALVAQPPGRMFALINDVESYPRFVPWCTSARIESRTPQEIVATLAVKRGAMNAEFTTRNVLEPDRRIGLELVSGPFRELSGEWLLTPIGGQGGTEGCRIELSLRFAFSNPVSAVVFEPVFQATAATLVDAFVARAKASHP